MQARIAILTAATIFSSCGKKPTQASEQIARYVISSDSATKAGQLGLTIEGQNDHGEFYAFGPASETADVLAKLPEARTETDDVAGELTRLLEQNPKMAQGLYNWDRVMADFEAWSKKYPDQTDLVEYGKTTNSKPLLALRIKAKAVKTDRSGIMITGATHGNEILTVDTVMGITNYILANLGTPRISSILAKHDIWMIPVVSPDSYVAKNRYVDSVDPNREYPWPSKPNRDSTHVIKELMAFFDSHSMAATLDYHSVAKVVMWPWAYTKDKSKDEVKFAAIAKKMGDANRYKSGQISKVMYIATGSSADYYYWKQGSLAMAIELSKGNPTSATTGEEMAKENLEATLGFLEMAP